MITSAVVTVFAHDAEAASAFFRDVLEFPCAHTGDGWLRFVPPTELSVHSGGAPGVAEGQHKLYLACDDIERTVEELGRKGVEFVDSIADVRFDDSLQGAGGWRWGSFKRGAPLRWGRPVICP